MKTSSYLCISSHSVDVASGRVIAPGETIELPAELAPHDAQLVADGHLAAVPKSPTQRERAKRDDNKGAE